MNESRSDFWFPAKKIGWGWGAPVKWQGWLVLILYVALLGVGIGYFKAQRHDIVGLYIFVGVVTSLLLAVMFLKGERKSD